MRAAAALVWLALVALPASGAPPANVPHTAFVGLDGSAHDLGDWLGQPLVLNVWATWCAPCREEMPALQRLADRLAAGGIRVAALSLDDDANLVREFVLRYRIRFPVGIARTPSAAGTALGGGLPMTLVVSRDGRVLERWLGPRDWSSEAVAGQIRARLAAR